MLVSLEIKDATVKERALALILHFDQILWGVKMSRSNRSQTGSIIQLHELHHQLVRYHLVAVSINYLVPRVAEQLQQHEFFFWAFSTGLKYFRPFN